MNELQSLNVLHDGKRRVMQWHGFVRFILQAQESVVATWLLAILFPLEPRVYVTSQDELCHRKIRGIKSMKPKTSCHGTRKSMSQHDQELPTTQVGKKVNVTTYIKKNFVVALPCFTKEWH